MRNTALDNRGKYLDSLGPAQPSLQWRIRGLFEVRATATATGRTTPTVTHVENARSPVFIPLMPVGRDCSVGITPL